jgi:hypothetical protein
MDEYHQGGDSHESVREPLMSVFSKVGVENARRILNILLESPFFYPDDDRVLFGVLRRNIPTFELFFEECFGWELYVDDVLARLVKPKVFNPMLSPGQRHIFRVTGRQEYVLLMLLLEFQEDQAERQNIDLAKAHEVCFVLEDFVTFVFQRFRQELKDDSPSEEKILEWARLLFGKLEHHRFIALREKAGKVKDEGPAAGFTREGTCDVLYALLPGLRCYRPEALDGAELRQLLAAVPSAESSERAITDTQEATDADEASSEVDA